jgi:hypothetical protein
MPAWPGVHKPHSFLITIFGSPGEETGRILSQESVHTDKDIVGVFLRIMFFCFYINYRFLL